MTRLSPSTTTSEPDTPSPLTRALMICCACARASRLGREPSGVVTTWMKLAVRDKILPDDPSDHDLEESEGLTDPGR